MNNFNLFVTEILRDNPSKISIAVCFICYHFESVNQEGVTIREINQYFEKSHLAKYNPTILKDNLRKSKNVIVSTRSGSYKPARNCIEEFNSKYPFLSIKSEEVITDNKILPDTLYLNTRGYIESLAKQINASYEHNIFDGCAVLMRRLFEILLIHSYEHTNRIEDIKENEGYKNLSFIINYTLSNNPFPLSKEVKEVFDDFRVIGNFAVHKVQFNCKRKDIDNIRLTYRLTIEELLYSAGIKK